MDEKLFQQFPPIPTQAWEEIIQKDLKGGDYQKRLVWKTLEGIAVRPYYRSEDLAKIDFLNSNPGEFPYTRGVKADNNWEIRQDIVVEDVKTSNALALKLIESGVNSLGFVISKEFTEKEFEQLLDKINLEKHSINIISGLKSEYYASLLISLAEKKNLNLNKISGSTDYDELGYMLINGNSICGQDNCLCAGKMLDKVKNKLPEFRFITVNARHFHNAGGSIVQELGYGLAMGAEYLKKFTAQNYCIDEIAPKMQFVFAIGSNYFMEIAKLRAARLLWAKIVEANSPKNIDSSKIYIHCETSKWNKTYYDSYVNMLRVTTEAMSAVLGGANSLNVLAFDEAYAKPNDFSLRIAHNVQLVIKEEAHFDKVVDPGSGSYYIENLSASIAEKAWALFMEVEEKGGFTEAFKSEFIQNSIQETANIRNLNIATRKEVILGTNQYPNFNEIKTDFDFEFSKSEIADWKIAKPIKLYRGAEEFEKLRLATDKSGKRPLAFMLTIGNLNFRKARAQFSANFFACAGFQVLDNNGFCSIDEGLAEAKAKNADIIVLCSSDEEYEAFAIEAFEKIAGKILVIAGSPACKEALEAKGIKNFIHVRSNVLEDLKYYQKLLGIN